MIDDRDSIVQYKIGCPDDVQDMNQVTLEVLRFMHEKIKNRECFIKSEIDTGMNVMIQCLVSMIHSNFPDDLQELAMDSVYLAMKKNMDIIKGQNEK